VADSPLAPSASALIDRVTEGVGVVREHTVEIGSRVLWIDNIGSLVILRGQGNYGLAVLGAIIAFVSLLMLQSQTGMALLLLVAGIALIVISLSQKIDNGLSIGTTDGRSTLIISADEQFLLNTLDLLCRKIDTGSITLQGTFDIGATHVNSGGGGVVVGGDGVAVGARGDLRTQTPPAQAASEPQTFWTPPDQPQPDTAAQSPAYASPEAPDYGYADNTEQKPRIAPLALILMVIVLIGAGLGGFIWWQSAEAERHTWEAVQQNDAGALRTYLSEHASGQYHDQALTVLAALEDQRFNAARTANDAAMLQSFLDAFPQSSHAQEINRLLVQLRQQTAFRASVPTLLSPASGSMFDVYPRQTLVQWAGLPGAVRYAVEIEIFDPGTGQWVENSNNVTHVEVYGESYMFNFVGAQPGRWRVRGVDRNGNMSAFSDWWTFEYKR
jgi:hypothetical protein